MLSYSAETETSYVFITTLMPGKCIFNTSVWVNSFDDKDGFFPLSSTLFPRPGKIRWKILSSSGSPHYFKFLHLK